MTDNERLLSQKYEKALQDAAMDHEPEDDLAPFTYKDIASIDLKTGHVVTKRHFQITKSTKSPWHEDDDDDEQLKRGKRRSKKR